MSNVTIMPHPLLDEIKSGAGIETDAELSRQLGVTHASLSKMRRRHLEIGSSFILRAHEVFGLPVARIRELLEKA